MCSGVCSSRKELFHHKKKVYADNNLAQRNVRPLVIARKISGGTRSQEGSDTRMGLFSLFGTWEAQGLNPCGNASRCCPLTFLYHQCEQYQ